ncbi:unnamed protein product [Urochloa humidicola]
MPQPPTRTASQFQNLKPSYEEAALSAEEARLWSVVPTNSLVCNTRTALTDETEKNAEVGRCSRVFEFCHGQRMYDDELLMLNGNGY